MTDNIGLIVQARSTSKRLPNKIFKKLYKHYSVLEFLLSRFNKCKRVNKFIVATIKKDKSRVSKIASKYGFITEIGSEKNVLSRFYKNAKKHKLDIIIRLNADSPLLEKKLIEKYIKVFYSKKVDYLSNLKFKSFPHGIPIEIFNFKTLRKTNREAISKNDKEHVTPYIYHNPKKFKIYNVRNKNNYYKFRFTIDYKEDLIGMKKIIMYSKKGIKINYKDAIKICKKNKKIYQINIKHNNTFT